ncbi:TPA: hypothetical protein PPD39_001871 [Acinetobacter baumannii]|nr:hypothetical protein [Acinetobacter baumannii]
MENVFVYLGVEDGECIMKNFFCCVMTIPIIGIAEANCPVSPVNTPSTNAEKLTVSKLGQFLKCDPGDPLNDQTPCNTFASRGLEAIYGVDDFKLGKNSYQSANQMWAFVNSPDSQWQKLGQVFNEQNNLCAQSMANTGWPVIALLKEPDHGHVALVIPGQVQSSGSWGMLVANSASFSLNDINHVYLSKPLSKAFNANKAQKAMFFYRIPKK